MATAFERALQRSGSGFDTLLGSVKQEIDRINRNAEYAKQVKSQQELAEFQAELQIEKQKELGEWKSEVLLPQQTDEAIRQEKEILDYKKELAGDVPEQPMSPTEKRLQRKEQRELEQEIVDGLNNLSNNAFHNASVLGGKITRGNLISSAQVEEAGIEVPEGQESDYYVRWYDDQGNQHIQSQDSYQQIVSAEGKRGKLMSELGELIDDPDIELTGEVVINPTVGADGQKINEEIHITGKSDLVELREELAGADIRQGIPFDIYDKVEKTLASVQKKEKSQLQRNTEQEAIIQFNQTNSTIKELAFDLNKKIIDVLGGQGVPVRGKGSVTIAEMEDWLIQKQSELEVKINSAKEEEMPEEEQIKTRNLLQEIKKYSTAFNTWKKSVMTLNDKARRLGVSGSYINLDGTRPDNVIRSQQDIIDLQKQNQNIDGTNLDNFQFMLDSSIDISMPSDGTSVGVKKK